MKALTSGASGPALTECPTQEPFSEILILAVESAMENLSLLNLLQGSSQNVPSQEPQTVPSPSIIVKELDEEQALQEVCLLQPEQFSECKQEVTLCWAQKSGQWAPPSLGTRTNLTSAWS